MTSKKKLEKALVMLTYTASSISTITINKYILSILQIKMNFMILALQSGIITTIIFFSNLISIAKVQSLRSKNILYWMPLSASLSLMIYTGSRSIEYLPISTFSLLKNGSIFINAIADKYLFEKNISPQKWFSFILMLISSYIDNFSGFDAPFFGYVWAVINIISTSLYTLLMKTYIEDSKSKLEVVFYCNILSVPKLILFSFFLDNITPNFSKIELNAVLMVLFSGISAFFTAYSTAWCLELLSSTSLSMLGAINKILISFSGIIFIGESNLGLLKILSLVFGSLASILYSKSAMKE